MEKSIVDAVRQRLQNKATDKLIDLHKRRSSSYSEEFFEAIREILVERGVSDASIDLSPPQCRPQATLIDYTPPTSHGHAGFAIIGSLAGGLVGICWAPRRRCHSVMC